MKITFLNEAGPFGSYKKATAQSNIANVKKELAKMDKKYQRAYVAIYTAKYKRNWQNGIGMHAGHLATRYYLIRVPDSSFIKQEK